MHRVAVARHIGERHDHGLVDEARQARLLANLQILVKVAGR